MPGIRILGGLARGRRLQSAPGLQVRPALARVRRSLFDILQGMVDGVRVLDLFAGTGSVGLEALSRGAREAVLVESDVDVLPVLRANAALPELADRARVLAGDAFARVVDLAAAGEKFDLVFVNPPYALMEPGEWDRLREMTEEGLRSLIAPDGLVILECRKGQEGPSRSPRGWIETDRRSYGQTELVFWAPTVTA